MAFNGHCRGAEVEKAVFKSALVYKLVNFISAPALADTAQIEL